MVNKRVFWIWLFLLSYGPSLWAFSLKDQVGVLEKRVVDFERLQKEQAASVDRRIQKIEKQEATLARGYRGFYDEIEAFREDLQQVDGISEQTQHSKRQLNLRLAELEKKLDAQGLDLFELKALLQAEQPAGRPTLSSKAAKTQFAQAMKLFRKKQWKQAHQALLKVANQSKDLDLAPEALYYGSFAAFIAKNWVASNSGFSDLISLYPQSKRVGSSRWRLALGLLQTKERGNAKIQLERLAKQKKNKKLATLARKKLKALN